VLIALVLLATVFVGLFVIVVAIGAAIDQAYTAGRELAAPGSVSPERLAAVDGRRTASSTAVLLVDLVGLGLLALWTRRLYENLRALGTRELRFPERWALAGWFVPFLNLVRPKQIVDDIWRASDPVRHPKKAWDQRPVSNLLHWWWFSWVLLCLPTLLGAFLPALVLGMRTGSVEDAEFAGGYVAWCGVGHLLFGVLTIFVVGRTTSRQVRLAKAGPVSTPGSLTTVVASAPMPRFGAATDPSGEHIRPLRVPTMEEP
jgi:hypothetical protein